jgi:hypothetical protein
VNARVRAELGGTEMAAVAFPARCTILPKMAFALASFIIFLNPITASREVHRGIQLRMKLLYRKDKIIYTLVSSFRYKNIRGASNLPESRFSCAI